MGDTVSGGLKTLIHGIGELVTLEPLATDARGTRIRESDLGCIANAWLSIEGGRVRAYGSGSPPPAPISAATSATATSEWDEIVDAAGALVMPGLIDTHTHPVFAGKRHGEFLQRLGGATYQEIATAGGGIQATVKATRKADSAALTQNCLDSFSRMRGHGVTTVEAKSGYGLSVSEELRSLQSIRDAAREDPIHVVATCLALHAHPPEEAVTIQGTAQRTAQGTAQGTAAFVDRMTEELLPLVAEEGLASYVDAFVENGYFTVEDCEPYFRKAQELGLGIRVHADEFSDSGAAAASARWGAASADHLQCASAQGIEALAATGTVATLLPGTSLYTKIPFANARSFADRGCAVAVASDFNPGSCTLANLPMLTALAAVQCQLTGPEAIAAVTYVAAKSLALEGRKGSLAVGYDADLLISPVGSYAAWLADFGQTPPDHVWIAGKKV